jgi:signal transduction histidine kinase
MPGDRFSLGAELKRRRGQAGLRLMLWLGFGGLLALLSFISLNALSAVNQVQWRNEKIRDDYLQRDRILEQLRSDLYLSGTYVRDFLLESDDERAEAYRKDFAKTKHRLEDAVAKYARLVRPEEADVFHALANGISGYFAALEPALKWTAEQRRMQGRAFMRDEVLRRRATMISIERRVADVNQRQLETGNRMINRLFAGFRTRLIWLSLLTLSVGLVLAAFSMQRIFALEREAERRYSEAEQARRRAQQLSAKLVDAQEEERRHIARELHDEVGQSLSALLLGIGNLKQMLSTSSQGLVREQIESVKSVSEKCVSVVRNMSLLLRPSMLDDVGLIPALQWQARETSRNSGIRVSVAADEMPRVCRKSIRYRSIA